MSRSIVPTSKVKLPLATHVAAQMSPGKVPFRDGTLEMKRSARGGLVKNTSSLFVQVMRMMMIMMMMMTDDDVDDEHGSYAVLCLLDWTRSTTLMCVPSLMMMMMMMQDGKRRQLQSILEMEKTKEEKGKLGEKDR